MKHLKTHKYPFNLLKVIYGDIISRDILSSLKSNPLTEQIFEIITYPYLSAYQREYLRDFYQDFLTIQEISEKDKRDKAFVEDSINLAIKKLKEQIGQAFKYAMNRGYIVRNPMDGVIKPKSLKEKPPIRAMTVEEESKFVDYITSKTLEECPYRNEFLIQLFMGLRVGECLALSTSDIDLMHKQIYVHRTLTTGINGRVMMSKSPKTKAGIRYLPIPPSLYPYIVEQMNVAEKRENNPEKMLFRTTDEMPYADKEFINRSLSKILKELGIEHMASHSLRHTYATRSIEAGVTPVVLQKLMGHTDVSITLNTYTSVFDKYKQTELEKVNKYYMQENLLAKPNMDVLAIDNGAIEVKSNETPTINDNNPKEQTNDKEK